MKTEPSGGWGVVKGVLVISRGSLLGSGSSSEIFTVSSDWQEHRILISPCLLDSYTNLSSRGITCANSSAEMKKSVVQRNASITTTTRKNRKIIMKKTVLALLVTAAISCGLFTEAKADQIALGGTATSNHDSAFTSPTTVSFSNDWKVVGSTGIFSGTNGQSVAMTSVSFSGDSSTASTTGPMACTSCPEIQWTFNLGANHYEFHLVTLTSATTHGSIAMAGTGFAIVNSVSYSGTWSMNGNSGGFNFIVNSVPDGGSAVALLGVALTGIEGFR